MYSKWRKSTVWIVQLQECVAAELANSRQTYKLIWELIGPKLIVPAVSLALSQRTTNNLDEASIKAKQPQTSKYKPTSSVFVNFRKKKKKNIYLKYRSKISYCCSIFHKVPFTPVSSCLVKSSLSINTNHVHNSS